MKINHDVTSKQSFGKYLKQLVTRRNLFSYIFNRIEWHYFPRWSLLRKYPSHIDIEVSSFCQLKCPMCFRFHKSIPREGMMTIETFKKIVDEISGQVYSIKFTGRGEPFLNKEFPQFLAYLKKKKFGEIAIITNGQFVTEQAMAALIDCGVDRIAFSIDGLKEEYERIRNPIRYDEIIGIVSRLNNMRNKAGKAKPLIRIQGVKSSIEGKEQFLKIWEPISDEILFLEYKDYSAAAAIEEQEPYPCPLLYQRMMIHWDGTVPMCINDEYEESVMGSIQKESVRSLWNGKELSNARVIHKQGRRDAEFSNCRKCALHRIGHGK